MPNPFVSIVIPFYKGEKYIIKTLESILLQSYSTFEILIINDGCPVTDINFFEKISQLDSRIKVHHKKNGGVACARQFGIATAAGDFIAFCDQDDLWLPEKLAKQMPLFENSDIGLVFCGAIEDHISQNRQVELPFFDSFRGDIYAALIIKNHIVSCTAVARKSLLMAADAFDADLELMGVDDWLAWLKLSLCCKVDFVEEYLAIHIFHENNYSSNEAKMYKAELVCLEKIKSIAKKHEHRHAVDYTLVEKNIHLRYAEAFIYNGDFGLGADALLCAASGTGNNKLKFKAMLFKFTPYCLLNIAQRFKRKYKNL